MTTDKRPQCYSYQQRLFSRSAFKKSSKLAKHVPWIMMRTKLKRAMPKVAKLGTIAILVGTAAYLCKKYDVVNLVQSWLTGSEWKSEWRAKKLQFNFDQTFRNKRSWYNLMKCRLCLHLTRHWVREVTQPTLFLCKYLSRAIALSSSLAFSKGLEHILHIPPSHRLDLD